MSINRSIYISNLKHKCTSVLRHHDLHNYKPMPMPTPAPALCGRMDRRRMSK